MQVQIVLGVLVQVQPEEKRSCSESAKPSGLTTNCIFNLDEEGLKQMCKRQIQQEALRKLLELKKNYYTKPQVQTFRALVKEFPQVLLTVCRGPKDVASAKASVVV